MYAKKWIVVLVAIITGACVDHAPLAPSEEARAPRTTLKWAPGTAPRFSATQTRLANPGGLNAAPPAPEVLSANQVSFWAYKSQDASVQVNWLDADSVWQPYVSLSVPSGSLLKRPDGSFFAAGDSVEITLTFDTTQIMFEAEPSGLVFNPLVPAKLKVYYGGTDPDLNGDGIINFLDNFIENVLLGLYTRQTPSDPWELLSSIQSLLFKRFAANVYHFCGYAVEW